MKLVQVTALFVSSVAAFLATVIILLPSHLIWRLTREYSLPFFRELIPLTLSVGNRPRTAAPTSWPAEANPGKWPSAKRRDTPALTGRCGIR
ncbi:hypothetical protein DFH08DRAFT_890000 [Mycena albidolilacea]|uniref:Uncharacterized protein n=1 Tax=Mycena albidolilacea TaxID=1033008 RepID=A0AAD6ZF15_9AGAR|nr:hypothetical protein DFH08DRAFT_890000 [Mycena albidolilacea]